MSRKKKVKAVVEVLKENSLGVPNSEIENYYLANKIIDALKDLKKEQ